MTYEEATKLIRKGDIVRLRQRLDEGLSPNLCNQYSWTLLMVAALVGNTSVGTLLIERGAELDKRNKFRETALSLATHTGHPSFVKLLLSRGASLECYPFGNTIDVWLDWVAQYGRANQHIRILFDAERKNRTGAENS